MHMHTILLLCTQGAKLAKKTVLWDLDIDAFNA